MVFSVMFTFVKFLPQLLFNKLIINAEKSLQSWWDRDSLGKKGGMAGLTGKNGRENGI